MFSQMDSTISDSSSSRKTKTRENGAHNNVKSNRKHNKVMDNGRFPPVIQLNVGGREYSTSIEV